VLRAGADGVIGLQAKADASRLIQNLRSNALAPSRENLTKRESALSIGRYFCPKAGRGVSKPCFGATAPERKMKP
jgi:hypothetical protein